MQPMYFDPVLCADCIGRFSQNKCDARARKGKCRKQRRENKRSMTWNENAYLLLSFWNSNKFIVPHLQLLLLPFSSVAGERVYISSDALSREGSGVSRASHHHSIYFFHRRYLEGLSISHHYIFLITLFSKPSKTMVPSSTKLSIHLIFHVKG